MQSKSKLSLLRVKHILHTCLVSGKPQKLILLFSVFLVVGCSDKMSDFYLCKEVPEGQYLLRKNKLVYKDNGLVEDEMMAVVRQQPNLSAARLKIRLFAHNIYSESSVEKKRLKLQLKSIKKNKERREREINLNEKRRLKAKSKGDSVYVYRSLFKDNFARFDSTSTRQSLKERIRYKFGEAPVIVDTLLTEKSKSQLRIFLKKKGYYQGKVDYHYDTIANSKKKRKIDVVYTIDAGPRFYIDSVYLITKNASVYSAYFKYIEKNPDDFVYNEKFYNFLVLKKPIPPNSLPFDSDVLEAYRTRIAKKMRDEAYYGFSPSQISYVVDTTKDNKQVSVGIQFMDKIEKSSVSGDSLITRPHAITYIKDVYFHIVDTNLYVGNFYNHVTQDLHLDIKDDGFIRTLDTLYFSELQKKVVNKEKPKIGTRRNYLKSTVNKNIWNQPKDSIAPNYLRHAYFLYNGEMFVQPGLIEAQNYLEKNYYYKEYYLERTYNRLVQLGIFSTIKPEFKVVAGTDSLEIHYYLIPAKKQSFGIEPRMTNSNGLLGIAASVNYSNRNLFKAGWNTTLSFSGGLESQPPVFLNEVNGEKIKQRDRSFNTFEIGPTLKFDLPGFFPINVKKLDKRSRPRTVLSAAYNFQNRLEFSRSVFQLNYLWKFYVGKTQIVSAGLPFASVIKFVAINKTPEFEARMIAKKDLYLLNAYSDQFIWEDLKLMFDFDNRDKDEKLNNKLRLTFNSTLNLAGSTLYAFKKFQQKDSFNHRLLFGVPYSQFAILDTKFISYFNFSKKRILAFRLMAGFGAPFGNIKTSLPYDYSFFAGGSNDNRGFLARSLGPGSYKYYMDTARTATQIGDMRLGTSLELRLGSGTLQSAFFIDAGNIWTYNANLNRVGSQFSKTWYKEIALTLGYGLRIDFDFFIIRLDIGFPLTNPALLAGERWIFQSHQGYKDEIATLPEAKRIKLEPPFRPRPQIGIGFPF